MDQLGGSGLFLSIAGAFVSILLAVIAVFLNRLLKQFDSLNAKVGKLNDTMMRIDKDLSGRVAVLDSEHENFKVRIQEFDEVFTRLRTVETDVIAIKAGGCKHIERCMTQ